MAQYSLENTRAIEVIYCYSDNDKDRSLRDELESHLMAMEREGLIQTWHEERIGAGEEWQSQIDEKIDTARIILPLISSDFISSDKSYELELTRSIKRHASAEAYVIPIILRPVDWQNIKFYDASDIGYTSDETDGTYITLGKMSVLPENQVPVTLWNNSDEAFLHISKKIRKLVHQTWKRDQLGVDDAYKQLKEELSAGEWKKANETTKYLVFKISNQEQTGLLNKETIQNFPSRDLNVINNLWIKYSNGHFGFSIQKQICKQHDYQEFLSNVGWYMDNGWLSEENLDYTIGAARGHLPYCGMNFWKAKPSPSPDSLEIPYYRFPIYQYQYRPYVIPPNYYRWRDQQKRIFDQQKLQWESRFKDSSRLLNSNTPPLYPQYNQPVPSSGAGAGSAIAGMLAVAGKAAVRALPWVIGATVVATGIYVGWKLYEDYQKDKEEQEKEDDIQEKINYLHSHLNSWTI